MTLKYANFNVTSYKSDIGTRHVFLVENFGVIDTFQSTLTDLENVKTVEISCGPVHVTVDVDSGFSPIFTDLPNFVDSKNSLSLIPFFHSRFFPLFKFNGSLRLEITTDVDIRVVLKIYRRPDKYFIGYEYKFLYSEIKTSKSLNVSEIFRPFSVPHIFSATKTAKLRLWLNEEVVGEEIAYYEFPPLNHLDDTSCFKVTQTQAASSLLKFSLTAKGRIDFNNDVVKVLEGWSGDVS